VRRGVDEKVGAAMGSFVHSAAERARNELALGAMRDVTIRCQEGTLICKATELADGRSVILAALVPPTTRFYTRPVNNALRKVADALRELKV
jgi:predicted regulator of Ras-like GTPase activity (Roadblock/LC7/MglB family)